MENQVIIEAIELARTSRKVPKNQKSSYLDKAGDVLLSYLKNNLKDTAAWLLLLRIECNSPHDV
jgi:hypothetical protein